jgi:hypothetical protein
MNKLDLIIEAIEFSKLVDNQVHRNELIEDALEDLRELRDMKPVAYFLLHNGEYRQVAKEYNSTDGTVPLYALEQSE